MKLFRFLNLLFLVITSTVSAQTFTQTIRGKVIDADTKSPLPGANIILLNTDTFNGASTDAEGRFRLNNVKIGRNAIKASFLGYDEVIMNNLVVSSGKELVIIIEMREKVYSSEEIEIVFEKDKTKANNELVTNSARQFRSEETERFAGSRGDPSRMVANYAGVATGNDVRNDIIVRGNSPVGVLWRLEGMPIPNPNHFSTQGATGGPISMLNNNVLGNTDFLTGAFPAEYGNKMAAVFDLKLRNGNNEKNEFTAQIGFNGLEFGAEGPINKKNGGSFLLNYRYSTLELFQLAGISFGVSATPKYQDFSFKVNLPTDKKGVFTIWGLGGMSKIAILDSEKDTGDWSFTSSGEDLEFFSSMGTAGIAHTYFFNNNTSGKLSISASTGIFKITIDTLSALKKNFNVYKNTSIDNQVNADYTFTHKINSKHLIKSGVTYSMMIIDYTARYFSRTYNDYFYGLKEKNSTGLIQGYIHWQFRITDKLTINNGLHYQNFLHNNSQAMEPRSGIRWQFHKKQTVNASYGMHSQTQPLLYYFYRSNNPADGSYSITNSHLKFSKSHHFIAGYDANIGKNFRIKIEPYYQQLYNIPIEENYNTSFSMINIGNDIEGILLVDSLTNKGKGKNYGAEFTIEKFYNKNYYSLLTFSIFESKYKGSDGIERFTAFSNGFVLNVLSGVEIPLKKGNHTIALDFKGTLAGGARYTPADLIASIAEKEVVYIDSLAFSQKLKNYSKVDFKISYKLNSKKSNQLLFISVENIFNTKNILRQVYDAQKGELVYDYQLGFFPYAGYRIEF